MKKIIIILTALLVGISSFAQSGKDLYNKYSDLEGVSAVYVSPAMFRMIGKIPDIEMEAGSGENVNLTPIIKSMTGFYLLEADNADVASRLHSEVKRLLDGRQYELLFEAKENGEITRLYTTGNDNTVTSLVLISKENTELTFMCLEGQMDREELENILAEAAAK